MGGNEDGSEWPERKIDVQNSQRDEVGKAKDGKLKMKNIANAEP
jgi:hypothetical protein